MTDKELIQQLKAAKGAYHKQFAPATEAIEKSRARLMAIIVQDGAQPARPLSFVQRFSINWGYFVPPQLGYAMGLLVIVAGFATFSAYAHEALPGQSLYSTKIALEQTHVRFVSNPSERAKVQMEFAGRRLEEARSASPEQESKTLKRFSKEVKQAKNTLKEAADPLQVEAAAAELSKKAREYQEELFKSKSIKSQRNVDVAAYEEAADALKEVTGENGVE